MGHLLETGDGSGLFRRVQGARVVTIGGGTGPFALLSRLKRHPCVVTAIVTMADSGGSSRRLMDEFGQLPFGDLRQALVALSRKGALWRDIFTYRFSNGGTAGAVADGAVWRHPADGAKPGVSGHSLGNLIISALQNLNEGNLLHAIADAQEVLDAAGEVLPVTLAHTTLCAELAGGSVICGESEIDTRGVRASAPLAPIRRVFLHAPTPPCAEAIRAIRRADVIVLGPGDLYTSILPNLLVDGVAEAIRSSEAEKVYVSNLMTKHGETDGFRASDFVREVHRYLGHPVDRVILHDGSLPPYLLTRYAAREQLPVVPNVDEVRDLAAEVIVDDLLAVHSDQLVRHDADRLLSAIFAPSVPSTATLLSATAGQLADADGRSA